MGSRAFVTNITAYLTYGSRTANQLGDKLGACQTGGPTMFLTTDLSRGLYEEASLKRSVARHEKALLFRGTVDSSHLVRDRHFYVDDEPLTSQAPLSGASQLGMI